MVPVRFRSGLTNRQTIRVIWMMKFDFLISLSYSWLLFVWVSFQLRSENQYFFIDDFLFYLWHLLSVRSPGSNQTAHRLQKWLAHWLDTRSESAKLKFSAGNRRFTLQEPKKESKGGGGGRRQKVFSMLLKSSRRHPLKSAAAAAATTWITNWGYEFIRSQQWWKKKIIFDINFCNDLIWFFFKLLIEVLCRIACILLRLSYNIIFIIITVIRFGYSYFSTISI